MERGVPGWSRNIQGWPEHLWLLPPGTFALLEEIRGRWSFRFYQSVKGDRAVRSYHSRPSAPYPDRIELRERDAGGRWTLWGTEKRWWVPFWLHEGFRIAAARREVAR